MKLQLNVLNIIAYCSACTQNIHVWDISIFLLYFFSMNVCVKLIADSYPPMLIYFFRWQLAIRENIKSSLKITHTQCLFAHLHVGLGNNIWTVLFRIWIWCIVETGGCFKCIKLRKTPIKSLYVTTSHVFILVCIVLTASMAVT